MKFEVGKFYRHNGGGVMHILAQVDNCTGFNPPTLVGESPRDTSFMPVGTDEDAAVNWQEIPPHLYYSEWLRGNEDSKQLRKLATPPGETEPVLPPPRTAPATEGGPL